MEKLHGEGKDYLSEINTLPPVILVVEDDAIQRQLMEDVLSSFNMVAVTFANGASALKWLAEHKPDLVLLDFMLPDISGLDVCQQIRKRFPSNILPVLMLSAAGHQPDTRMRGLEVGVNDFMAKPYHIEELILNIQRLLNREGETREFPFFALHGTVDAQPDQV